MSDLNDARLKCSISWISRAKHFLKCNVAYDESFHCTCTDSFHLHWIESSCAGDMMKICPCLSMCAKCKSSGGARSPLSRIAMTMKSLQLVPTSALAYKHLARECTGEIQLSDNVLQYLNAKLTNRLVYDKIFSPSNTAENHPSLSVKKLYMIALNLVLDDSVTPQDNDYHQFSEKKAYNALADICTSLTYFMEESENIPIGRSSYITSMDLTRLSVRFGLLELGVSQSSSTGSSSASPLAKVLQKVVVSQPNYMTYQLKEVVLSEVYLPKGPLPDRMIKQRELFKKAFSTGSATGGTANEPSEELFMELLHDDSATQVSKYPSIYSVFGLLELDRNGSDRYTSSELAKEARLCVDKKFTYLQEATDYLEKYCVSWQSADCTDSNGNNKSNTAAAAATKPSNSDSTVKQCTCDSLFDPIYFLACAYVERKRGDFEHADEMRKLFFQYVKHYQMDNPYMEFINREISICDHIKIIKEQSNANSSDSSSPNKRLNGANKKEINKRKVYQTKLEEWADVKKNLTAAKSDKYKRAITTVDKIMAYCGVEDFKSYVLQLFKRVVLHSDPGSGENFNYRMEGNPGTGKTTLSDLLAALLFGLGIRASDDSDNEDKEAEEKRTKETAHQAQMDVDKAQLKKDMANIHEMRAKYKYELAKRNHEEYLSQACDYIQRTKTQVDTVCASNATYTMTSMKQSVDNYSKQCTDMKLKSEGELRDLKLEWEREIAKHTSSAQGLNTANAALQNANQNLANPKLKRYIQTSGGELARKGADHLEQIVQPLLDASPPGGIIFVDEVGQLLSASKGMEIISLLLLLGENHRDKLSFILAGYPSHFKKVMLMDPGLSSRFPNVVTLKDYTSLEFSQIFDKLIRDMKTAEGRTWTYNTALSQVVGRRIERSSGVEGFGNAREVRNYVLRVKDRYYDRIGDTGDFIFTTEDILGKKPVPENFEAYKQLQRMVGIKQVKEKTDQLMTLLNSVWEAENDLQIPPNIPLLNQAFVGNPGVGKTTVAKIYAELLKETGFLTKGEILMTTPAEFIGINRQDTISRTSKLMDSARGNILLIDEAYGLDKDAIDALISLAPAQAGADMAMVMCGYKDEMNDLITKSNPGLKRRFPDANTWEFQSYNEEELRQLFMIMGKKKRLTLPFAVVKGSAAYLAVQSKVRTFGNGGAVDTFLDELHAAAQTRIRSVGLPLSEAQKVTMADYMTVTKPKDDPLMDYPLSPKIQEIINQMACKLQMRQLQHLPVPDIEHMILVGNAGIGKTTQARKMAGVLKRFGILPLDKMIECNADTLVGQFVGQTQQKVQDLLKDAEGGVLFVDEAHRLRSATGADAFKQEALGVIMKALEPNGPYHNKLLIIFAGYEVEMRELLQQDQGLERRFKCWIQLDDLTANTAMDYLNMKLKKNNYMLPAKGNETLQQLFCQLTSRVGWSNVADVNTIYERLTDAFATRLLKPKLDRWAKNETITPEEDAKINEQVALQSGKDVYKQLALSDVQAAVEFMIARRPAACDCEDLFKRFNKRTYSHTHSNNNGRNNNNEDDVYRFNTNANTNKRNRNIERQAEPPQVEEIESEEEEEPENVDMEDVGRGGGGGGGGKFWPIMVQLQQALPGIDIEDLLKTPAGRAMMAAKLAKLEGSCTLLIPGNIKPSEQQISEQLMKLDEELHNKNDQELLIIDEEKAKSRQKQQEVEAEMEHLQLLLAKETDERIKAEHERKLRELERQRLQEEENLKRLSRMQSLCPAGFAWVQQGSGWRCLGGAHFVPDDVFNKIVV